MHPHARAMKAQLRPRILQERWTDEEKSAIAIYYSKQAAAAQAISTAVSPVVHPTPSPSKPGAAGVGPALQVTVVSTKTPVATPVKPTVSSVSPVKVTTPAPHVTPTTVNRVIHTTSATPKALTTDDGSTVDEDTSSSPIAPHSMTTTDNRAVAATTHSSSSSSKTSIAVKYVTEGSFNTQVRGAASSTTTGLHSATAQAANASSSTGMSGGAIAGIVIAVLLGLSAAGAFVVYFLKKRNSNSNNGWSKMDDDVTPYPSQSEKPASTGYYGAGAGAAAAGAGAAAMAHSNSQSRGLAVPNDYYESRPMSDVGGENFAGYGAGRVYGNQPSGVAPVATYGINQGYADPMTSPHAMSTDAHYYAQAPMGFDEYGMPYHPAQQQAYTANPFEEPAVSPTHSAGSAPRQLVGPGQQYPQQPYGMAVGAPVPIPLGRPEAPNSYDDIAAAEMYADDRYADDHMGAPAAYPNAYPAAAPVQRYTDSDPTYSPHAQTQQDQEWPNEKQMYAQAAAQAQTSTALPDPAPAPATKQSPAAASAALIEDHRLSPLPEPAPLPQLAPMSPFMDPIALHDTNAPTTGHHDLMDDDETNAMYADVAAAAGIPMSAQPYQHGQPLTPVREVATPVSEPPRPLPATPTTSTPTKAPLPPIPSSTTASSSGPLRLPPAPAPAHDDDDAYGGI